MYKKIALTLTLALAMFAGTAVQAAHVATTKSAVTVVKGEKGGKKKKKECTSGEKSGCCAGKTAGENGGATGTSANGGATGKTCPNGAAKCCDKKAAEKN